VAGFFQEHLRPLAGSAGLHVGLLALLGIAALRWNSTQPPVELAIEGYVAEAPPAPGPAPPPRAAAPPKPVEAARPPPQPAADPADQRRAEQAAAAERAARDARAEAQAAAEKQAAADRKAADEKKRQAAEAAEAKRKAAAQAQAERDARLRAEREAELQRSLAAEEESAAIARSGVMDEYRALLRQTIERNWIRPPSARAGLECTLLVTQAPGGTVIDVRLGTCNGDEAVRESITNAVFRASPLPAPRDPRAFERRLEIVFKPTE
jgi:colicin import membrane protein